MGRLGTLDKFGRRVRWSTSVLAERVVWYTWVGGELGLQATCVIGGATGFTTGERLHPLFRRQFRHDLATP